MSPTSVSRPTLSTRATLTVALVAGSLLIGVAVWALWSAWPHVSGFVIDQAEAFRWSDTATTVLIVLIATLVPGAATAWSCVKLLDEYEFDTSGLLAVLLNLFFVLGMLGIAAGVTLSVVLLFVTAGTVWPLVAAIVLLMVAMFVAAEYWC